MSVRWNIGGVWYTDPEEANKARDRINAKWDAKTKEEKEEHIKRLFNYMQPIEKEVLLIIKNYMDDENEK